MAVSCQNHIYSSQLIINVERTKENYQMVSKVSDALLADIKKELFKKTYDTEISLESSLLTINIIGNMVPYHYDQDKEDDAMMKYNDDKTYRETETKIVLEEIFQKNGINNYTVYIGFMEFLTLFTK